MLKTLVHGQPLIIRGEHELGRCVARYGIVAEKRARELCYLVAADRHVFKRVAVNRLACWAKSRDFYLQPLAVALGECVYLKLGRLAFHVVGDGYLYGLA